MADGKKKHRPSGVQLPLEVRRLFARDRKQSDSLHDDGHVTSSSLRVDRTFTSEELQERFQLISAAMIKVQNQLYRGEEIYHEETHQHGNLHRGWDTFVDARDLRDGSAREGGSRRLQKDQRWFSGSCRSVSRYSKPVNFTATKKSTTLTNRSETNTPFSQLSHASDASSAIHTNHLYPSMQPLGGGAIASSRPPLVDVSIAIPPATTSIPKAALGGGSASPLSSSSEIQGGAHAGRRTSRKRKAGEPNA